MKQGFTLSEGATHVTSLPTKSRSALQCRHDKRAAFTLAEVLITLGIIGVVAAITIPNLVANYQKRAWTAQLQKNYAMLNQGFRRMLADDNTSALSQTEVFQSIGGNEYGSNSKYKRCLYSNDIESSNCKDFYSNLRKYLKILRTYEISDTDNYIVYTLKDTIDSRYSGSVIQLINGTIIFQFKFYSQEPQGTTDTIMQGQLAQFNIDINGFQKPNKFGRDVFAFWLGDNGVLYPNGSLAYSEMQFKRGLVSTIDGRSWKNPIDKAYGCRVDKKAHGSGCTARVLEEGKMNY